MGLNKVKEDTAKYKEEAAKQQKEKSIEKENTEALPSGANPFIHSPQRGIELLTSLTRMGDRKKEEFRLIDDIERIVKKEFLPLTERDENPTGAQTYSELIQIVDDLEETVMFPELVKYPTVGVGGMFSAGKSLFLNSVLGFATLLPTATTPSTSIPTFIYQSSADESFALNCFQHKAELDIEGIHAISHDFFNKYKASFGHVLKIIAIGRKDLKFSEVIFLDTPGYSKTDDIEDKKTNVDEQIALEHLRKADYLVWLVDVQNGTIPSNDIDFIKKLNLSQPILYVFNKADKKLESDCEDIVSKAWGTIKRNNLPVYDVVAFSAKKSEEIGSNGKISAFLKDVASKKDGSDILFRMNRALDAYKNYYDSQKHFLRDCRAVFNELLCLEVKMRKELTESVRLQNKRYKTQIDSLASSEMAFEKMAKQLNEHVVRISEIIKVNQIELNLKMLKSRVGVDKNSMTTIKLPGHINFGKNSPDCLEYNKKSQASLVKVLVPAGIVFRTGSGVEILASLSEAKKKTGLSIEEIKRTFKTGLVASVHRTGEKECVIECKI